MREPLLSGNYSYELRDILLSREDWHPFPTADERDAWTSLPDATRQAHIKRGEKAIERELPAIPATIYLDWYRSEAKEDDWHRVHGPRRSILSDLVIAECIEGKGRFMDAIINIIWAICEETAWYHPAHVGGVGTDRSGKGPVLPIKDKPTIALRSARTASLLAWTTYLLGNQFDSISPVIRERIQQEIEHRTLKPYLERYFRWMFFDFNWNTYCNYHCLPVILLMEQDETRRLDMIHKMLRSLDQFIIPQPSDGSCTEGPSYWNMAGGALFGCLELLHSITNGKIDIYNEPLIQDIGRFIYRVHINDDYFINISDCRPKVRISGDLVSRYGKRIGDEHLTALGIYTAAKQYSSDPCVSGLDFHELRALFNMSKWLAADQSPPLVRDVWLGDEEMQMMAARTQEGSSKGLYVAAWGGHNRQHHNHNDVGNFIVYVDGNPIIIDTGPVGYSNKSFSANRYDIWSMQSAYHNLPTISGIMQKDGREFAAKNVSYKSKKSFAQLTMDIAGAYPSDANVDKWVRTVRLNRGKNITVTDSYKLTQAAHEITLSIMTPCIVTIEKQGQLTLKEVPVETDKTPVTLQLYYDAEKLTPNIEKIFDTIEDSEMKSRWGEHLTRIVLRAVAPQLQDTFKLQITQ